MSEKNNKIIKHGVRVWLFNTQGQILLGFRLSGHGAGTWSMPGGKPEKNETSIDTAIREVCEETGIHLSPRMLKHVYDTKDDFGDMCCYNVHYRVDDVKAMPSVIEKNKCREWRWFDLNKLPSNLTVSVQNLLNQKLFGDVKYVKQR